MALTPGLHPLDPRLLVLVDEGWLNADTFRLIVERLRTNLPEEWDTPGVATSLALGTLVRTILLSVNDGQVWGSGGQRVLWWYGHADLDRAIGFEGWSALLESAGMLKRIRVVQKGQEGQGWHGLAFRGLEPVEPEPSESELEWLAKRIEETLPEGER
jgi:hypothetical protein